MCFPTIKNRGRGPPDSFEHPIRNRNLKNHKTFRQKGPSDSQPQLPNRAEILPAPSPSRQCRLKSLEVLGRSSIDISQTSLSETPAHWLNPPGYSNTSKDLFSTMSPVRYLKGNAVWTKNPLKARRAFLPAILGGRHHYST